MNEVNEFNWAKQTWDVIDSGFENDDVLIQHQLESYNNFIEVLVPSMMKYGMPITMTHTTNDAMTFEILKCGICKPIQYSKRHYRAMYPAEARYRNLTYGAPLYIDIAIKHHVGGRVTTYIEEKIHVAKIPIMLGSKYCHLHGRSKSERVAMNECPMDRGGYFIVNGSEKVIISQERPVENSIAVFEEADSATAKTYAARVETKSTLDQRFFPIKTAIIKLTVNQDPAKDKSKGSPGHKLYVFLPYGRRPIPLFVIFKAFGVITDREIFSYLLDDENPKDVAYINMITPSAVDAHEVQTQIDAIRFVSNSININIEGPEDDTNFRMKYAKDLLNREFLPHVGNSPVKKLRFVSLMVRRLLEAYNDPSLYSDRDKLTNKRLDLPGTLLSQIFRFWFQRLLKDIKQHFSKVLSSSAAPVATIVQDIRRLIQKSNIENKIKYALATGNWFTNRSQANSASKKGIAQVVQRLAFSGTTSHLNRITSPLERAGSKHEPPRRLHGSQPPKICPNETPEGAQIGTVKNLALLTHVSIETSAQPVLYCLNELGMLPIEEASSKSVHGLTKIMVNGDFVGLSPSLVDTDRIYRSLIFLKRTGTLSCYISIAWHHDHECIVILTDGGRYSVPYYTIDEDNHFKIDNWILAYRSNDELRPDGAVKLPPMDDMTTAIPDALYNAEILHKVYNRQALGFDSNKEAALEYLDTNEDETLMLADSPEKMYDGQTYRLYSEDARFYGHLTLYIKDLKGDVKAQMIEKLTAHYTGTSKALLIDLAEQLISSVEVLDEEQRYAAISLYKPSDSLTPLEFNVITNLNRFVAKNYIVYTHCLIHPATINGVVATNIPFSDHNQSPRNCYQSSMGKQAIGIYVTNAHLRMDTTSNILAYPHKPVVFSRTAKHTRMSVMHHGFMSMIAIACFGGYNQEDSLLGNRDSAQRGTFNTIYSRTYHNKLQNLANQDATNESFVIPPDNRTVGRKIGAGGNDRYHAIVRNYGKQVGKPKPELPFIGAVVGGNDIIIPKCKSISKKGTDRTETLYSDSSTTVRPSETGVVDMIIPNEDITNNEDEDGYQFCKVRISDLRAPEIGDKFASRAAQKGTEGIQYNSADIMFNQDGVCPDKIMNPHGVPSRMTQGMTYEAVCSKEGVLSGKFMDATAFTKYDVEITKDHISEMGYDYAGDEIMYNGHTGDMFEIPIFFNPIYYQRLKHMVTDKMHARNLGPVQSLTKQPAEGRARAGGLRLGEMERDCLIAHGVAQLLKFKLTDDSDIFEVFVSKQKQTVIAANPDMGVYQCGTENVYGEDDVCKMHLPYAMNLFRNELRTSMIDVKLIME